MEKRKLSPIRFGNTNVTIDSLPWILRFLGVSIVLGIILYPSCGRRRRSSEFGTRVPR